VVWKISISIVTFLAPLYSEQLLGVGRDILAALPVSFPDYKKAMGSEFSVPLIMAFATLNGKA